MRCIYCGFEGCGTVCNRRSAGQAKTQFGQVPWPNMTFPRIESVGDQVVHLTRERDSARAERHQLRSALEAIKEAIDEIDPYESYTTFATVRFIEALTKRTLDCLSEERKETP